MLGSLLSAGNLSPMEASAFFHDKLFGSPSSSPSPSENGFLTYQDYPIGITIKHSSEWQKSNPRARP